MITQDDITALGKAAELAGFNININQIQLLTWNMGIDTHVPLALPDDFSAVYIFEDVNRCLKVGKAGPGSRARYLSHHYNIGSSPSNLAKSLQLRNMSSAEIKTWIRTNTCRYNILIPNTIHQQYAYFVNFAESFFILKCNPVFEG